MSDLVKSRPLLALEGLGLSTEVGGSRSRALEEAGEEGLDQGVEDNGGTTVRYVVRCESE